MNKFKKNKYGGGMSGVEEYRGFHFKKKKYLVLKKVIDANLADFLTEYMFLKKEVANTLFSLNYLPPNLKGMLGTFNDPQVPNSYSVYSDIANEVLLKKIKPIMEKNTGLKLVETYSYARIYNKGNTLERHKDRPSCEISTTLNLGGGDWPIYLEPSGKEGMKGIKINLKKGDMLIYKGCELEHWRKSFTKKHCVQVFLHYNQATKKAIKYYSIHHLGLPFDVKKNEII